MSGERLVLALLGCGEAARTHAKVLGRVADDVAVRFASRDRAKAEAFDGDLGGDGAYGSYREALEDPEVDAAVVLTPPHRHRELVEAALEHGRHALVEKPAFPRPEDFAAVREAARAAGRRVLVAENYRYKPLRRELARLLEEGAVGRPLMLQVDAVKEQATGGWRDDPERAGGGALLEGGIHWVNFMAELGLEVEEVEGRAPAPTGGPERSMVVLFRYAGGAVGTLSYSWEVPSPLKGLRLSRIYGREGALTFESNGLFVFQRGRRLRLRFPGLRDIAGYRGMWRDLVEALRTGREPAMTLDDAERDVRLVREAYRTAGLEG